MPIMNMPKEKLSGQTSTMRDVVGVLNLMSVGLHLTGSRFFGGSNEKSDWDFMIADDKCGNQWLSEHGFERLPEYEEGGLSAEGMACQEIACVYRNICSDGHVDIQVCSDLEKRLEIQEGIKRGFLIFSLMGKRERSRIWRAAFAMYNYWV